MDDATPPSMCYQQCIMFVLIAFPTNTSIILRNLVLPHLLTLTTLAGILLSLRFFLFVKFGWIFLMNLTKKKKGGEGDRAENWQAGYTVLVLYLCCLPSELKLKISNNKTVNLRCRNELGISHFDLVRFVSEVCLRLSRSLVSELIASELHPSFIFDIYYRT